MPGTHRVMDHQFPGANHNPVTCNRIATAAGYPYYSLQYGGECWATYNLQVAQQYGRTNQCTMPCKDETTPHARNCGGVLANAIYRTCGSSQQYTYRGCFVDGCTRTHQYRTMEHQFPGTNYDVSTCYQAALSVQYAVFALQYGGECWASNSLNQTTVFGPSTSCDMFCNDQTAPFPGNCGGILANAVYTVDGVPVNPDNNHTTPGQVVTYTREGCYADGTPRTMEQLVGLSPAMDVTYTIETCARSANAQGYTYFALQWGGECWVGNSLQQATKYGRSSRCIMPCRTDELENCGGVLANNLFSIDNPLFDDIINPNPPPSSGNVFCPNSTIPLTSPQYCSDGFKMCNGCEYCPDGQLCCNCGAV